MGSFFYFLFFQALNWLLRSVTQPTCLHDLLWCFVAALTPANPHHVVPAAPSEDPHPQDQLHIHHHRDKAHDLVSREKEEEMDV